MHCSVSFILFSSSKLNPPYIFIFGLLLFNISKPKNFYETQHRCSIHKWISQIWIQDTVIYVLRENHINWSHSKIFSFCCWVSEGHKIGESPSLIYMKSWFHELATICINISPELELFFFYCSVKRFDKHLKCAEWKGIVVIQWKHKITTSNGYLSQLNLFYLSAAYARIATLIPILIK